MSLEDVKSPLPPRKFNTVEVEENIEKTEPILMRTPEVPPSADIKPKRDISKFLIFGGIGVGIIILSIIFFTVIKPKFFGATVKKETVINYWGLWEDENVMNGVIADFEAKNPNIKINYKNNQKIDYRTRLKGRLNKVDEVEVPDIFRIHSSWIPMFRENLAPVETTTVEKLGLESDFFDVYKKDLKENGVYLAIPLMYDGLSLFYNKDLLESAQVQPPKSWWDLESTAKKLTVKDEKGRIAVAGAAMGLVDNVDHWSDIVGLMMKQNGVNLLKLDESNNRKLQDVLTFYTLFKTKDEVWDESLPPSTEYFANGKLAFYFGPSWRAFNIEAINPNLRYEIINVPQLAILENGNNNSLDNNSGEMTNIHWSTYWVEGVNKNSKNQAEAWKFLEFMASREGLEKAFTAASQVRSFGEIYPRKSMVSIIETNNKIKPFVTAANNASGWYLSSDTFDDGLNDEMRKYFGDAINSMTLQNTSVENAVVPLRNGINQLTQKYQLTK